MENVDVARLFQEMADLLELRGDNPFRIHAYRTAARTLEAMPNRVAELVGHDGKALAELPGIGKETNKHGARPRPRHSTSQARRSMPCSWTAPRSISRDSSS